MDFSYSEQQQDVQNLARKILEEQASPERQRDIDAGEVRFDTQLWQQLAESGLLGVAIDEAQGGMGFDFETLCLLVEEVGRSVAPLPVIPALVSAALPLQRFGSDEQKQSLAGLTAGASLLTTALVEPGNEDLLRPLLSARAEGSRWIVTGCKHCVPYAAQSQWVLLSAESADTAESAETAGSEAELLVFLVPVNSEGLSLQAQQSTSGEPWCQLQFEAVSLEEGALVARGDRARQMMHWCLQLTRAASAIMAVGLCDRMMRMTAEYTSQREQFGVAVATFQAVGHRAADCYIDVDVLRLVSQEAVSRLTLGLDAEQAVTIAKIWTGDVTHRISQASQHLHGGIGVDRDYPLFRYCLMARQLELSCGTTAQLMEQLGTDIAVQYLQSSSVDP